LISGWEWVVIIIAVGALILWGPKKIPELARAIGEARGEFERASREAMKPERKEEKEELSSGDVLIETARKLGISTEGKTKDQISREIVEKVTAAKETSA